MELFFSDILVALVEESPSLPSGILEIILAQFTSKNAVSPVSLLLESPLTVDCIQRMDHPAYRLAVDVCKSTSDRLQGLVAQYFTDIIVQHDVDDDEKDDIKAAHELIIQLNRSCPALLNNVVPQLGEELGVDDVSFRTMATQTLGEMFSEIAGEELAKKYPATWKAWVTRTRDKSAAVRVAFIEASRRLLSHHNSLSSEIECLHIYIVLFLAQRRLMERIEIQLRCRARCSIWKKKCAQQRARYSPN